MSTKATLSMSQEFETVRRSDVSSDLDSCHQSPHSRVVGERESCMQSVGGSNPARITAVIRKG